MCMAAYRLVLWLALPWVLIRLWWRGYREPGYRREVPQRFGFYGKSAQAHRDRSLIWLHAVSVGETRAAEPLVRALAASQPGCSLLVTHMTATGRDTAKQLFGDLPAVQFAWLPYDYPGAVRRFIRHFHPALGIVMETEAWPHLLREFETAGIPTLLANARLSEKSARGYRSVAPLAREVFSRFSAIAAQTRADAERLLALGARAEAMTITGNMKFDITSPPAMQDLAALLRARIGPRKVVLAASTRDGEEALLLDALQAAGGLPDHAVLLMVPRHPQRFSEVASLFERRSLKYMRRSDNAEVPADCQYVLGDSLGEMPAYYGACDCAYVGGSLLPYGGQNLIEACAAGVPVLIGPHTYNFLQAATEAVEAGAAVRVDDAHMLVREAARLLADPRRRQAMAEAGLAFCRAHRGATARIIGCCERLLNPA